MRRLLCFGVSHADGYRHLMRDGILDEVLVDRLVADYIRTRDAIVYADRRHGAIVPVASVFSLLEQYRKELGTASIRIVASDLSAHVVIESIGVGVGEHRRQASPGA